MKFMNNREKSEREAYRDKLIIQLSLMTPFSFGRSRIKVNALTRCASRRLVDFSSKKREENCYEK